MANISFTTPDSLFPTFEENNFNGWLTQFRAHLRRYGAEDVLDTPMPSDKDVNGNPIPMNARDRADLIVNSRNTRKRIILLTLNS